jgi:CAAX protease family protein
MPEIDIPQYSNARVLGVWAATALPMRVLVWILAPTIASRGVNLIPALIGCLTAGLVWLFVLLLLLNGFSLRGLRLQPPSTSDGPRGGRLWLWVLPFALGFGALQLILFGLPPVASYDFGTFLASDDGHALLRGNWRGCPHLGSVGCWDGIKHRLSGLSGRVAERRALIGAAERSVIC